MPSQDLSLEVDIGTTVEMVLSTIKERIHKIVSFELHFKRKLDRKETVIEINPLLEELFIIKNLRFHVDQHNLMIRFIHQRSEILCFTTENN